MAVTVATAIVSVSKFLQPLMPVKTQIVRGQANNVPAPLPPSIVLTPIGMPQYTTTRSRFDPDTDQMNHLMPKKLNIQMDFYGFQGGDMSNIAVTVLRSLATEGQFPDGVIPLFCQDPTQFPLTTGEKQYEDRWSCTLTLQYNAPVLINQDSFNVVGEVGVDPANVTYPTE